MKHDKRSGEAWTRIPIYGLPVQYKNYTTATVRHSRVHSIAITLWQSKGDFRADTKMPAWVSKDEK